MIPIDIQLLVDKLDELLEQGWRLPLGNKVALDEDLLVGIIDQMRITIPQEIKQARQVQQERDKYVAQAHDEARQIIAQAREDAARLLDEHKLREVALEQVSEILASAQREADQIRSGADEYAEAKMAEMSDQVARLQATIQNGLEALKKRRLERSQPSGSNERPDGLPRDDKPTAGPAPVHARPPTSR